MTYDLFFKQLREKNFTNIQVTEKIINDIEVEYIDEKLENNNTSYNISYEIKAEKNNKPVKLTTDYIDSNLIELLEEKIAMTDSKYEDDYLIETSNNNKLEIENINIKDLLKEVKEIYKLKGTSKYLKNITSYLSASSHKKRIINSNGVDISTINKFYSFSCDLVLEKDNTIISHSNEILKTSEKEINIINIVKKTIKEAEKMLIKEELKTGKYNIILSNNVASSIISKILQGIYANNIREKVSIFENKINKQICGKNINIVEEPLNKNYPGFTIFDNDGTPTYNKDIIKNGVLNTYLYDIKEAKYVNKKSTANSFNGINTRNAYLIPENNTKEELINKIDNGLLITDYMGSQGTAININTGSISLQIFGLIIENGEIKCGFEPCILTTTIKDLLNNITLIGNDLEFFNTNFGSPSILIEKISIAGK